MKNPKKLVELDAVRLDSYLSEVEVQYQCVWSGASKKSWVSREWLLENNLSSFIKDFERKNDSRKSRSGRRSPRLSRARTKSPSSRNSSPAAKTPLKKAFNFSKENTTKTKPKPTTLENDESAKFWSKWSFFFMLSVVVGLIVRFFAPDGPVHVFEELPLVVFAASLSKSPEAATSPVSSFLCLFWMFISTAIRQFFLSYDDFFTLTLFISMTFLKASTSVDNRQEDFLAELLSYIVVCGLQTFPLSISQSLLLYMTASAFFQVLLTSKSISVHLLTTATAFVLVLLIIFEALYGDFVFTFQLYIAEFDFRPFEWIFLEKWIFAMFLTVGSLKL